MPLAKSLSCPRTLLVPSLCEVSPAACSACKRLPALLGLWEHWSSTLQPGTGRRLLEQAAQHRLCQAPASAGAAPCEACWRHRHKLVWAFWLPSR